MARSRWYVYILTLALPFTASACHTAEQDRADHRRLLAQQACEEAVRDQLSSRATAQFLADSEHVYYDSTGGAGVAGVVSTTVGQRNFTCILKPALDSSWSVSAARLLN